MMLKYFKSAINKVKTTIPFGLML